MAGNAVFEFVRSATSVSFSFSTLNLSLNVVKTK